MNAKFKLLKEFFKDYWFHYLIFFINTWVIFIFYRLTGDKNVEIIYPIVITFMLGGTSCIVAFYRYYYVREYSLKNKALPDDYSSNVLQRDIQCKFGEIKERASRDKIELHREIEDTQNIITNSIHNMRAPLMVLNLMIDELIEDGVVSDKVRDIKYEVERIECESKKAIEYIRVKEFVDDFVPQNVNIKESIENVIKRKKNQFIYNKVMPDLSGIDDELNIFTDKRWNEFIYEQIIINAVKYSKDKQEPKVWISTEVDKNRVAVIIKDNGIGIERNEISSIFKKNFTGTNGRKTANSSGIGLHMCNLISKKLEHKISVESEIGVGTVFKIEYEIKE